MARIRSIKPEFWTSEQVMECSLNARLLFIGLWNFADDLGRLPMSAKSVKAMVFPSDDLSSESILGMLAELSGSGLILQYEVDGKQYLQITGWQHQRIDKPQPGKYPAPVAGYSKNTTGTVATDTIGKERKEGKGNEGETRAREPSKIPEDFALTPADIDAAHDVGMTDATIDAELKIFKAKKRSAGTKSADWSSEWLIWCERWKGMQPAKSTDQPSAAGAAFDIEAAVRLYARTRTWSRHAPGGEPGMSNCQASPELLAKYGLLPDGRPMTSH